MDYLQFSSNITVPKQSVQDLLVCAFEGGSNYWYDNLATLNKSDSKVWEKIYNEVYPEQDDIEVFGEEE